MSKIEEMERYIERTNVKYPKDSRYQLHMSDINELFDIAQHDLYTAIGFAFKYGRAMGERHARKELKKV